MVANMYGMGRSNSGATSGLEVVHRHRASIDSQILPRCSLTQNSENVTARQKYAPVP